MGGASRFGLVCPNRSPQFGVSRRGSPRFVPICSDFPPFSSDLFQFALLVSGICSDFPPSSSDLFRFALLVFGICSDLFRFAPISSDLFSEQNQNKSGKPLSADPFCKSPNDEDSNFQFSESGGSVNGPNLFTQLPFL